MFSQIPERRWAGELACRKRHVTFNPRVLGSERGLLSPESTSCQPPWDLLRAVWSQSRRSLSCGKGPKTRGFSESDVRRKAEETRRGGGRKCGEPAYGDSRQRRRRPGKPWKTGLSTEKIGCEQDKLGLRENRRSSEKRSLAQPSP